MNGPHDAAKAAMGQTVGNFYTIPTTSCAGVSWLLVVFKI